MFRKILFDFVVNDIIFHYQVETIIQIEILALKYQLKCFDSGNRKAMRQYLRDVTRHWMIPREGQNLKSEIYVNSLFEVLYNRAYTLDNAKMEK